MLFRADNNNESQFRVLIEGIVDDTNNWTDGTKALDKLLEDNSNAVFWEQAVAAMKHILKERCHHDLQGAVRTIQLVSHAMLRHGETFEQLVAKRLLKDIESITASRLQMKIRSESAAFIRRWATNSAADSDFASAWVRVSRRTVVINATDELQAIDAGEKAVLLWKTVEGLEEQASALTSRVDELRTELDALSSLRDVLVEREEAVKERESVVLLRENALASADKGAAAGDERLEQSSESAMEKRERALQLRESAAAARETLFKHLKERMFGSGALPGSQPSGSEQVSKPQTLSDGATKKKTVGCFSFGGKHLRSKRAPEEGGIVRASSDPLAREKVMVADLASRTVRETRERELLALQRRQEEEEERVQEAIKCSLEPSLLASVGVLNDCDVDRVVNTLHHPAEVSNAVIVGTIVGEPDSEDQIEALLFGRPDGEEAPAPGDGGMQAAYKHAARAPDMNGHLCGAEVGAGVGLTVRAGLPLGVV